MAIAIAATISVERNIWTCDRQQEIGRGGGRKAHTKLICVEGHGLAGGYVKTMGLTRNMRTHAPKQENSLTDQLLIL